MRRTRQTTWLCRAAAIAATMFVTATAGIAAAPDACACTCRPFASPEEAVRAFDTIFVGKATSKKTRGDEDVYDVEVGAVYTGEVGATATVTTSTGIGSCGTTFRIGYEQVFFVGEPDAGTGEFWASMCGPEAKTSYDREAVLKEVYGEPRPVAAPDTPAASDTSDTSDGTVAYVVAGVAAAAVLGAVGLMVALSRRHRSQ